uniref:Uncharacterized protein n=1 Tax=Anguilla anguilla TaxID=7936 RepID=A0A0E9XM45_ANGAN
MATRVDSLPPQLLTYESQSLGDILRTLCL